MTFSSKMDYEVGNIQDLKYLFFPSLDQDYHFYQELGGKFDLNVLII